jgi:hypothetical protein
MPNATYRLMVDWDNNGTLEDQTTYLRISPGIKAVRGRDQIRSLAPPMAGSASCEVDNQTKRYSPEYVAGALYGNLLPGRRVQIEAIYAAVTYYLWTGYLDDLPQYPDRSRLSVGLPAIGPLSKLANQQISTALYSSIATGTAIGHVLDAVGWPAGDRVIDTGNTTLDWWWLNNTDAISALRSLLASEGPGAAIYEDGLGRIVFEDRGYRRTTARSITSQETFSDTGAQPTFGKSFAYNPELKNVFNLITITIKTRTAKASAAVWSLGNNLTLAVGEVRAILATASDPFTNAITPVSPTDYTASAGSLASVVLSRTSGTSTVITLTAGASGATLTGLQLRAQTVTVDNTTQVNSTLDTSASIAKYGRRVYNAITLDEVPFITAQDLTNAVVALYQEPRPTVKIQLDNGHADRLVQSLTREISDRITIIEPQTGLSADFFIEQIAHEVVAGGLLHRTIFGCEQISGLVYGVWGTSEFGTGIWGW